MSEISSGLVAVRIDTDGYPLVRLSDAEAIIAQKDAEILDQCRLNGMGAEREAALLGKVAQLAAALNLAMEALVTARDTFTRYSLHHEAKGDFEKAQANKAFADSLKKALAAIDALKGE